MRNRREIAIDLTALLDVILIILFMFVMQAKNQVEASVVDDNKDSASSKIVSLQEENESLKQQIVSEGILNETCLMVTISVETKEDKNDRTLKIITNANKDNTKKVKYNWDKLTFAKNKLKDSLDDICDSVTDKNQMVLFVFQYNKDTMYMADYKLVDAVLKDIQDNNKNVYLAYYDNYNEKDKDKE